MKPNKITSHIIGLACLLSFVWLYFATKNKYDNLYLFEWTADHSYLYIWIWIFYLTGSQKDMVTIYLTIGNFFGIYVGQYLGSFIREVRMSLITPETAAGDAANLARHFGFEIWLISLFVFTVLGILVQTRKIHYPKQIRRFLLFLKKKWLDFYHIWYPNY